MKWFIKWLLDWLRPAPEPTFERSLRAEALDALSRIESEYPPNAHKSAITLIRRRDGELGQEIQQILWERSEEKKRLDDEYTRAWLEAMTEACAGRASIVRATEDGPVRLTSGEISPNALWGGDAACDILPVYQRPRGGSRLGVTPARSKAWATLDRLLNLKQRQELEKLGRNFNEPPMGLSYL